MIATSSHRGVVKSSATGVCGQGQVPVGQSFPRVINGFHFFSAKVCNTADKRSPFVAHSDFLPFLNHNFCNIGVTKVGSTFTSATAAFDEAGASVITGLPSSVRLV